MSSTIMVYVPPREAIMRGSTKSGWIQLDFTEEQLASLSAEQRAVLGTTGGLDGIRPGVVAHEAPSGPVTHYNAKRSIGTHAKLTVASWGALVEWIDTYIKYDQAVERAKAQHQDQEKIKRINALQAWEETTKTGGGLKYRYYSAKAREVNLNDPEEPVEIITHYPHVVERDGPALTGDRSFDQRMRTVWAGLVNIRDMVNAKYTAKERAQKDAAERAEEERRRRTEEAKRAWLEAHGDDDLRERYQAGVLADNELFLAIRDQVFGRLDSEQRFERIEASELGAPSPDAMEINTHALEHMTSAQWKSYQRMRGLAPEGAEFEARQHVATWADQEIVRCSLKISINWHGRPMTRVYALA